MSRRQVVSPRRRPLLPVLAIALSLVAGLLLTLPAATAAQESGDGVEGPRWQLLEYRDESGSLELVPPGIGATALLWFKVIKGEGACSTYESTYTLQKETLIIDEPAVTPRGCDAEARAIDEAFYRGLAQVASWSGDGSILELRDPIGELVMTFTSAQLPSDPTIAPWELARVTAPDGSIGPVIQGTSPRLQFLRGGRVVGTTGCGTFLGSYDTNDTVMRISDVTFRLEDCTPELRAQAENIVSTLDEISDFEVRPAGLTLEDQTGVTRLALVPAIPLGRRAWMPIDVLDPAGESLIEPERLRTSSVRFANVKADGRTVCRSYSAGSLRSGLALTVFDPKGPTAPCRKRARKGQSASQQEVEDLFLEALQKTSSHALRGDELEFMDADGRPVMRLLPQPELVGVPWRLTKLATRPNAARPKLQPPKFDAVITATFETVDVLQGETGKNDYIADYSTPGASRLEISGFEVVGNACGNRRKAAKPLCVQEALFKSLLESTDGYVVLPEGELRLLDGSKHIMSLEPVRRGSAEG